MGPYSLANLPNDKVGATLSIKGKLPSGPNVLGCGIGMKFPIKILLCFIFFVECLPASLRWLSQLTKDMPHVKVISIEDDQGNDDYDWNEGAQLIKGNRKAYRLCV
jgi:hypothetical protein